MICVSGGSLEAGRRLGEAVVGKSAMVIVCGEGLRIGATMGEGREVSEELGVRGPSSRRGASGGAIGYVLVSEGEW